MNKRKTLLQGFIEYNAAKRLAGAKKCVLLAVSGGVDSVAMCDLFSKAGFPFEIAHCNFQLRGEESDGDEKFVQTLSKTYKVPVSVKRFDTKKYADEKGVSIQVAARELRYGWFEQLRVEKKLDYIATAHHLNDNIETIFFNLVKGSGIRGLRGIPVKQGKIIRPLLFASREEIEAYQNENKLEYREDSSNKEDKYTRNKIRQQIIPLLKEINPALEDTLGEKIELFSELEEMYNRKVNRLSKQLFISKGNATYVPILKLKKTANASSILFEYLKDFDFTSSQVEDILASLDSAPGKQFVTAKARIIKDRKFFILTSLSEEKIGFSVINAGDETAGLGEKNLKLSVTKLSDIKITADKQTAFLDASKIEFPLIARKWKPGDYFYPFGMKLKKKKLKKFFTDEKVPLHEKENVWVLESNKKIVWVVGYRIDERMKVTPKTAEVLKIQLK